MPRKAKSTGSGLSLPVRLRASTSPTGWTGRPHGPCPACGLDVALLGDVLCRHTDALTSAPCAASGLTLKDAVAVGDGARAKTRAAAGR